MHVELGSDDVDATTSHPFYVVGRGWVAAGDLVVGDSIRALSGDVRTVTALRLEKLESPIPVYNLDVEDFNSYFVGSGLLVHNVSCKSGWKDNPDTPINKQLQGTGQISPLRTNPNMMEVDVDALLQETPKAIEQLAKKGKITARVLKAINKAFERRKFNRR